MPLEGKLLARMAKFIALFMVIVSLVYTYLQTHKIHTLYNISVCQSWIDNKQKKTQATHLSPVDISIHVSMLQAESCY